MNQHFFQNQFSIRTQSLDNFLYDAVHDLSKLNPEKYVGVDQITNHAELPICIVVDRNNWQRNEKFIKSVKSQNYLNYNTALVHLESQEPKQVNISNSFIQLKQNLTQQCKQKSILLFLRKPLANNALSKINSYYQTYNAWMTYSTQQNQNSELIGVEISSVYQRVFDFIDTNSFFKTNRQLLESSLNPLFMMTSLFQLCKFFALSVSSDEVFQAAKNNGQRYLYHSFSQKRGQNQQIYRRQPYQSLHSLAQNYKINNLAVLNQKREYFMKSNSTITQKMGIMARSSMISHEDMIRAIQYEQIIYLPKEHTLNILQIKRMQSQYETGRYSNKQLPLCININSHNNIENERYKKVLDSVTAQNYTNYRIVFIDDCSDDDTLKATQKYLEETLDFSRERVTYVKNKQHTFATYNIINAAFNFCEKDSIQVLVDGDDQLIGKQVFKLINAEYQKNNLWVMYTFYKSDKYDEGISIPFKGEYLRGFFGGRKLIHYFGPTRTFKVSLIRKVPLSEHLNERGNFLDTMYDTALQYPLFQMSGRNHSKFVNYTSYLYFSGYGGNDDSNIFKKIRRIALNIYVSMKQPLQQLQILDDNIQNEEVAKILKEGEGKIYEEIK